MAVISPTDFNECLAWGKEGEEELKQICSNYGFELVRADKTEKEKPDLALQLYVESKRQTTPFRIAQQKFGIEPAKCITINIKNLEHYKDFNCLIVFNIDYEEYGVKGFYCISAKQLWQLYQQHPERCYSIKFRGAKHKTKNFALSIDECLRLEDVLIVLQKLFGGSIKRICLGG